MEDDDLIKLQELSLDFKENVESRLSIQNDINKQPTQFFKEKYEKEAGKNWDIFYKRNTTNFFKDRHWTGREFFDLNPKGLAPNSVKLLEIGCAVGNFLFPLLKSNPELFIYACDFSPRAIEFVKGNQEYTPERCLAFVCDITKDCFENVIPLNSVDIVSNIFVLSAIPPVKLPDTIKNIAKIMKPGGIFIFRDYAVYDAAQVRFKAENKIGDNFYVRSDGTFSFFFTTDFVRELFESNGFKVLENEYVIKKVVNRKRSISMDRVFLQARLEKNNKLIE
jgi:methyltransferase-like protein 6